MQNRCLNEISELKSTRNSFNQIYWQTSTDFITNTSECYLLKWCRSIGWWKKSHAIFIRIGHLLLKTWVSGSLLNPLQMRLKMSFFFLLFFCQMHHQMRIILHKICLRLCNKSRISWKSVCGVIAIIVLYHTF